MMLSTLDIKAYAVKTFFNFWGRLGGTLLNLASCRDVEVISDLAYGPAAQQRLDIFRPMSAVSQDMPVLIFFHGGGWISADKSIYQGCRDSLQKWLPHLQCQLPVGAAQ